MKKKEKPLVNLLVIPGSDKECKKCIMHHILKILSNHYPLSLTPGRLDRVLFKNIACILSSVYACPFVAIFILLNFIQFKTSHLLNLM